jgi:hypothetical protein
MLKLVGKKIKRFIKRKWNYLSMMCKNIIKAGGEKKGWGIFIAGLLLLGFLIDLIAKKEIFKSILNREQKMLQILKEFTSKLTCTSQTF